MRLFKEIQERNSELREALEHQTATSEVLGIISRSPTDVQPVLDAIVESAARVCGVDDVVLRLRDGNVMVMRAHFGPIPIPGRVEISIDEPWYRWMREHGALHVPDVRAAQNDFPTMGSAGDWRTILFVPLCQQGELIGSLIARRMEVAPSPRRRSSSSKPSPTRLSSPSRTSGCLRTQGVVGTADCDERDLGGNRQLTDGYSAGVGRYCRECRTVV